MALVVDDLTAWLVALLAETGRKKLTSWVLGTDQQRSLQQAAEAAIERTAEQLALAGGEQAEQLAMVVGEVFHEPTQDSVVVQQATLLEALQAGIVGKLAVLDDPDITGTGQSSAELLGVPGVVLAETLAGHLVREIVVRGSQGGPLAPLADQLNHDVTHLQGQRLEGMLAQVVGLVLGHYQVSGTPAAPRKPVRLAPRPVALAGRDELLSDVGTRLGGGGEPGPRIVALWGLGGAGKTSAAVEYAHRHLAEVGVAWQFACEDAAVLAAGFAELAAQLEVEDLPGTRDPVASVHAMLAASPANWLVVFDNAPDWAAIEAFLPPAGPGAVLITSQSAAWPPGWAVQVPMLDTQVAAEFLVNRTGDPDRQAAVMLAIELGGLPLALEQVGAYVQTTGTTLAGYLALFEGRRAELLARGEAAGHPADVAATLGLALSRLAGEAPAAAGLARLLACLAAEPVPLALLLQHRPGLVDQLGDAVAPDLAPLLEDPLAAGDAIAALRRYSLVTPGGDGTVLVHRLVQAITLAQLPTEVADQWRQAAATLVEAAIPAETELPAAWPVCAVLLPHARAILGLTGSGLGRIATYLGFSGSYSTARDLFQLIADAYREDDAYGPEHPETLDVHGSLAYCTGQAGDAVGARDRYAALLSIQERVLGAEHPDTQRTRHNVAAWTGFAGDAAGARDQLTALLPVVERTEGPEHPSTLRTRHELARWTGEAGDAAGARDQYAALLPIREQIQGSEHPDTLVTRNNLAFYTGAAGDTAGARDQYAAFLPIVERVLGAEHPNTLTTRANLARWTGEAGDAAGARDQYAALLPVMERVLGAEHPITLTIRARLA